MHTPHRVLVEGVKYVVATSPSRPYGRAPGETACKPSRATDQLDPIGIIRAGRRTCKQATNDAAAQVTQLAMGYREKHALSHYSGSPQSL